MASFFFLRLEPKWKPFRDQATFNGTYLLNCILILHLMSEFRMQIRWLSIRSSKVSKLSNQSPFCSLFISVNTQLCMRNYSNEKSVAIRGLTPPKLKSNNRLLRLFNEVRIKWWTTTVSRMPIVNPNPLACSVQHAGSAAGAQVQNSQISS